MSATVTKRTYDDLIKHTERPISKRRELAIGRGGELRVPRKFHLSDEEVAQLKEEYKETKRFPNPHNKGFYHYLVEALVGLGINEKHSFEVVKNRVEKLMSDESTKDEEGNTVWTRWAEKDPRNKKSGLDRDGRFYQNVTVLQRLTGLTPYGRKILDVGQKVLGHQGGVIDVLNGASGAIFLRLNTRSARPINERKTRGMGSPAEIAEERDAKRKAKPCAAKRKAKAETAVEPVAAE